MLDIVMLSIVALVFLLGCMNVCAPYVAILSIVALIYIRLVIDI